MDRYKFQPSGRIAGLLCLSLLLRACSDPSLEDRSITATLEVNGVRGNPNGYTFAIDGGRSHPIAADGVGQPVAWAWDNGDHRRCLA